MFDFCFKKLLLKIVFTNTKRTSQNYSCYLNIVFFMLFKGKKTRTKGNVNIFLVFLDI